jgi:hypothetical protein
VKRNLVALPLPTKVQFCVTDDVFVVKLSHRSALVFWASATRRLTSTLGLLTAVTDGATLPEIVTKGTFDHTLVDEAYLIGVGAKSGGEDLTIVLLIVVTAGADSVLREVITSCGAGGGGTR